MEPKIEVINAFIEEKLKHFEAIASMFNPRKKPDQELLEAGFRKILNNLESNTSPESKNSSRLKSYGF